MTIDYPDSIVKIGFFMRFGEFSRTIVKANRMKCFWQFNKLFILSVVTLSLWSKIQTPTHIINMRMMNSKTISISGFGTRVDTLNLDF